MQHTLTHTHTQLASIFQENDSEGKKLGGENRIQSLNCETMETVVKLVIRRTRKVTVSTDLQDARHRSIDSIVHPPVDQVK